MEEQINNFNEQEPKSSKKVAIALLIIILIICIGAIVFMVYKDDIWKTSVEPGGLPELPPEEQVPEDIAPGTTTMLLVEPEVAERLEAEAGDECLDENGEPREDDPLCVNDFYYNKAAEEKDEDYCMMLVNETERQVCLDNLNTVIATGENPDITACQKLSNDNQKIACTNEAYYNLAYRNQDKAEEYCNQISVQQLKDLCLDRLVE